MESYETPALCADLAYSSFTSNLLYIYRETTVETNCRTFVVTLVFSFVKI